MIIKKQISQTLQERSSASVKELVDTFEVSKQAAHFVLNSLASQKNASTKRLRRRFSSATAIGLWLPPSY